MESIQVLCNDVVKFPRNGELIYLKYSEDYSIVDIILLFEEFKIRQKGFNTLMKEFLNV